MKLVFGEELVELFDKGSTMSFSKEINLKHYIERIKKTDYKIPHKYFTHFVDKYCNETCIIEILNYFYKGALKVELGDWVQVVHNINYDDIEKTKIVFSFVRFYNRTIDFKSEEDRNKFIMDETEEAKITMQKIISELKDEMPLLDMIEFVFGEFVKIKFEEIIEEHMDKINKKMTIPLEELDAILLTEIFSEQSVAIKENLRMLGR